MKARRIITAGIIGVIIAVSAGCNLTPAQQVVVVDYCLSHSPPCHGPVTTP